MGLWRYASRPSDGAFKVLGFALGIPAVIFLISVAYVWAWLRTTLVLLLVPLLNSTSFLGFHWLVDKPLVALGGLT